jgi:hypothetical protein
VLMQYAGLNFELEHISRWEEKAVYSDDGADFLYVHVTIGVQAVWNPSATRNNDGDRAAASFAALRQVMLTPRRQLKVDVGGTVVLEAPGVRPGGDRNFVVDAKNGPQPLAFQVLEVRGVKTAVIYWECECYINACCNSALLSHRWEMTHEISEMFITTRRITGRAVFRSDFLRDYPGQPVRYPDDWRVRLFHPIPDGFQRDSINVVAASDGLSAQYQIVDQEQWLNRSVRSPVVRIQGEWKTGIVGGGYPYDPTDLGSRYVAFSIRVWGSRKSTRQSLIDACFKGAAAFNLDNRGFGLLQRRSYYNVDLTVNVVEKEAQLTVGYFTGGAIGRVLNWFNPAFDEAEKLSRDFPEDMVNLGQVAATDNPRPPTAGCRGGYVGRMVAQALLGRCETPAKPPAADVTAPNFTA